ncbi:MAG TPA: DUF4870 domain-containing protein [Planctomycetaceae bacterium]|nr:DUF4870 domain-containing protein [Planctomycetaceae bacterium]
MSEETPFSETPKTDPTAGIPSKDERNLAMICHLLGLVGFVGPLVIWLIKKDESTVVDDQGKESLNFQLTILLASLVSGVLACFIIGFFLAIAVAIYDIVYIIIAAMKANEGELYRYPICLRLIK